MKFFFLEIKAQVQTLAAKWKIDQKIKKIRRSQQSINEQKISRLWTLQNKCFCLYDRSDCRLKVAKIYSGENRLQLFWFSQPKNKSSCEEKKFAEFCNNWIFYFTWIPTSANTYSDLNDTMNIRDFSFNNHFVVLYQFIWLTYNF